MTGTVVAFAGGIASGKSTLSRSLAEKLGWPRVSFGDHVRRVAAERELDPTSRTLLQDLGQHLVLHDLGKFVSEVLAGATWRPGQSLIIDGLRHAEVAEAVRLKIAPSELLIVYVDVGLATREQRAARRMTSTSESDVQALSLLEQHPVETQVTSILRERSSLVVDGELAEIFILKEILGWLEQRLC